MLRNLTLGLVTLFAIAVSTAHATVPDPADIRVHVQKDGAWVKVDVDLVVDASPAQAWNVLTDYDHMQRIVSNVEQSKIIKRDGERLEVAQKGRAGIGLLSMQFENVREVVLTPEREIRSRMISGDMKSSEFTTRITDEGGMTRITNHGRYMPAVFVPPVVGPAFIESETRKQFQELRAEMLRRKSGSGF